MKYILSIDQGTTGTRAILFDENLDTVCMSYMEHEQIYPQAGWVEHNPEEIFNNCLKVSGNVLEEAAKLNITSIEIRGIGLSNQGETVVAWNRITGKPVYNAIVWQCRRTTKEIENLKAIPSLTESVHRKTGLTLDAYFSASKIKWIIDNVEGVRQAMERGEILAGTLDSWIIWKLTGGKSFYTDPSTASRTMLYNIHTLDWDDELLSTFGLTRDILPSILPTSGYFGNTDPFVFFGLNIPITGSVVDQQGALFGQSCISEGMMKCTYGTGCFLLMNIGEKPLINEQGILTSVGWQIKDKVCYVLEGGIYVAGTVLQWLRDNLELISDYSEADSLAEGVPDTDGVCFVPAFSGLAAPIWDSSARGTIVGITAKTSKEHIIRAALESIAYQVKMVLDVMVDSCEYKPGILKVDGGISRSNFLMQFQADILGIPVEKPSNIEATAMGAALFAGLSAGVWDDTDQIQSRHLSKHCFYPQMDSEKSDKLLSNWKRAVNRSLNWANFY
ncbi:MAG TPA: glycerol kinase GlpK [Bacillota bacterium]|nr:glycerol kinase GlpK [Bacillota bacterium]HOR85026.1 glycerol kinase GlpK [Bacillota bacterium]HPL52952.1 glycerol kinase GlpK [Bacillota bacterium]